MAEAADNAMYRVPQLEKARIVRGWAGLYKSRLIITPFWDPFLKWQGSTWPMDSAAMVSSSSPAVGKVMAELIVEGKASTIDISPLSDGTLQDRPNDSGAHDCFKE